MNIVRATANRAPIILIHGAEGRGGEKGHDIVDPSYLALVSDQGLRSVVIAGRTDLGMPDWRENTGSPLTSQQVSDVVAWMAVHRAPVMGRPVFGKPGG